MKNWKYITGLLVLWLIFSSATVLCLFQFLLSYGKVEVKVDYTAYERENVSVYWNKGNGWGIENRIARTTRPGRHIYTYNIRHADSVFSIRIDPDEKCDSALLHSVSMNGTRCSLSWNDLSGNEHHNARLVKQADGLKIFPDADSYDPNIVIPVPASCNAVDHHWKTAEIIYIILTLLFDVAVLIFAFRRRFLIAFFQKQKLQNVLFVFAFLLCISMYWADRVLDFYPQQPNIENRRLIKFPEWKMLADQPDSFFIKCTQWCSDYFMYRNMLIRSGSAVYIRLFKTSPIPRTVLIGKDNMFFPSFDWFMNDFTGKMHYTQPRIDSICRFTKEKQEVLSRSGIDFFLVFVPAKQTVYNDLMPEYYRLQQLRPSLLDQVVAGLGKYDINFMSLTDTLINIRQQCPEKPLFYNYDTHWNEYGAFKGYQAVMKRIYDSDSAYGLPLSEKEVTTGTFSDNQADLSKCLIVNDIYKRTRYNIQAVSRRPARETKITEKNHGPTYIYYNPHGHGRALFLRDSYMIQWAPYFVHHFKECILVWDHTMYMEEIIRYKPDILILEVGEFYIDHLLTPIKYKHKVAVKKN
jgi:alginate O-acetyltransferase complex protein AlgJ